MMGVRRLVESRGVRSILQLQETLSLLDIQKKQIFLKRSLERAKATPTGNADFELGFEDSLSQTDSQNKASGNGVVGDANRSSEGNSEIYDYSSTETTEARGAYWNDSAQQQLESQYQTNQDTSSASDIRVQHTWNRLGKTAELLTPAKSLNFASKNPMKPLQWDKIANHIAVQSIWKDLFTETIVSTALENYYLVLSSNSNIWSAYCDFFKLAITLKGLRLPFASISLAIKTIDDDALSIDQLSKLSLMDIPRIEMRMNSMILGVDLTTKLMKSQQYVKLDFIDMDCSTLLLACDQILKSNLLRELLQAVLIIGNYLNGTSFRGNARGFRLESLMTARDTKANNGKAVGTLLHYLAQYLQKNQQHVLEYMSDMHLLKLPRVFLSTRSKTLFDNCAADGSLYN
ncbi:hypothetical protein BSLG_005879 [Batrachochytrium salamandrivorans]|nr:hypothetical protein BSLG_005879 [Batrachochytrium salamandrivorans]